MAGEEEDVLRNMAQNIPGRPDESQHSREEAEHTEMIVLSGVKLLPNVPTSMGETKSKSK